MSNKMSKAGQELLDKLQAETAAIKQAMADEEKRQAAVQDLKGEVQELRSRLAQAEATVQAKEAAAQVRGDLAEAGADLKDALKAAGAGTGQVAETVAQSLMRRVKENAAAVLSTVIAWELLKLSFGMLF